MNYKILNTIGEAYSPEARPILEALGDVDYKIPTQKELPGIIGEYDIVLVGLGLMFDRAVLEQAAKLKVLATATTGLDHIDVAYLNERGVKLVSLRGEDAFLDTITGTAELALGLLIDLSRQVPQAMASVREGAWLRENFRGHNLSERTLGIVGLGRLGRLMARYGKAFGMRVIFTDPKIEAHPEYEKMSFEGLLSASDAVSIHVHLAPETEHMFDAAAFAKMKPGAYLINTSRDKIVDEAALIEAMSAGKLGGYGTDVLSDELDFAGRIPTDHPLWLYSKENPNVLIVPHIGGMTVESRIKTDVHIAELVRENLS